MKILFVCHRFPFPPNEGGKIRAFNMIAYLQEQHEVTVASLTESLVEENDKDGIAPYCNHYFSSRIRKPFAWIKALLCMLTLIPSSMGYFHSRKLKSKIQKLLIEEQFDLIVVHCSSVAHFVLPSTNIPKILDYCDMDSQKWLVYRHHKPFPVSLAYWLEGVKLQRAEKKLANQFDGASVATSYELETLNSFNSSANTFCFPNGVDTDYFSPTSESYDANSICFMGKMNYYPNEKCMLEFSQNVFPLLREKYPSLKLIIVGSNPTAKIQALTNIEGIEVTGRVEDVRPHVQNAALSIVPLTIARGTQNKILESMAMGVPVVCSRIAARGIDAVPGEHVLVANTPKEYVACISRLIDQPTERERFAQAGRQRMLSHHSWKYAMQEMDSHIQRCLRKQSTIEEVEIHESHANNTKLS